MDVNANSQSSLSTNLNHPQVAIAEELENSISIVGSTSAACLLSDNIHDSASDPGDDNDSDGDDVADDDYSDLYDDDDYDYMFESDDENIKKKKAKISDDEYSSMQSHFDNVDLPPGVEASVPDLAVVNSNISASRRRAIPANFSSNANAKEGCAEKELDVVQKYLTFKRFDIVDDFSDHYYLKPKGFYGLLPTSTWTKPTSTWTKKIQDEWKILESNLPDTIYVRVYEGRMDLLRAVIIGPTGTPYHDGLFTFDVHFPSGYPCVPPLVYYHSGGLRINPNLYENGKVCLSLLNTWRGEGSEKWLPNKSTILQVLVSIQALILNAKPFFNEPGYDKSYAGQKGERMSTEYSKNTFVLSLRTMIYTLRTPPKNFEDFVSGHFRVWGRVILIACRAYMEGADVGSDIKGKIEDSDKGEASQREGFQQDVATMLNLLVESFIGNGSTDCEEFRLAD